MVGFQSYNKLTSDIKNLRQIYDFTYHLYLREHELIKDELAAGRNKVHTFATPVGVAQHTLISLFHYT